MKPTFFIRDALGEKSTGFHIALATDGDTATINWNVLSSTLGVTFEIILHGFALEYRVYVNTPFKATSLVSWSIMVKSTHAPSVVELDGY